MASSEKENDQPNTTNETLYNDSYFRVLRSTNDLENAKKEFRTLIMQNDMHFADLNMSQKNADEFKSELIFEYSSMMDSNQEGLLPIIDDEINESYINTSLKTNINNSLTKGYQYCMQHVHKCLSFPNTISSSVNTKNFNCSAIQSTTSNNSSNMFKKCTQPLTTFSNSTVRKQTPIIQTTLSHNKKNNFDSNPPQNKLFETTLKKRTAESGSSSRISKKLNNRTNYDCENQLKGEDKTTNSFMPASSMYKNPLKKAHNSEEQKIENTDNNSSSDVKKHSSLKNFDAKIVEVILSEIMDFSPDVKWNDIAGLEFVKSTVQEIVIWPLLRPDIFTGLRAPPRGILLFGPPGTGKTLIGKCIATESNSTFFCISASSLASKWVGESEQLVRALFAIAQLHQPAVIFIDEIDSLLSQRSDQEQDHTRKLKTEFLVQFDGAKTTSERRILVVGATNRPHELDEAARRRFVKRLYVPLPGESARLQIIEKLLSAHQHNLSSKDFQKICQETEGYSGSDVAHLCKEAAMGPIRSIGPEQIITVSLDQVRPIELIDFLDALKQVRASVAEEDLNYFLDWNKKFGSFPA